MIRLADGAASLLAAVIALAVSLPPAWFTHIAVRAGIAPAWAWGPAGLLALLGLILGLAFARKGFRGIAPSRDRQR